MAPYTFTDEHGNSVTLELAHAPGPNPSTTVVVANIRDVTPSDGTRSRWIGVNYSDTIAEHGSFGYDRCERAAEPDSTDVECREFMTAAEREIARDWLAALTNAEAAANCDGFYVDAPTVQMAYKYAKRAEAVARSDMNILICIAVYNDEV